MRLRDTVLVLLPVLLLESVAPVRGAGGSGRIHGSVTDLDGMPIAAVEVTIRIPEDEFEERTATDKKGRFKVVLKDPERDYVILLRKEGYQSLEQAIEVLADHVLDASWILLTEEQAAERAAELADVEAKNRAAGLYNEGATAYNSGDLEGAIEKFRQALGENPDLESAHASLVRIYLEREQWEEAVASGERLAELRPDDKAALLALYDAYWGAGDRGGAVAMMEKLKSLGAEREVGARVFNEGVAAVKESDLERARERFEAALALDENLYQAHRPLAQIYSGRGDWESALVHAEALLEKEPTDGRAHVIRYKSLRNLGRMEAADEALRELRESSPEASLEIFFEEGLEEFASGQSGLALESFRRVLEIDPDHPRAHYQVGLSYASLGENDRARAALQRFVELAPDDPEVASAREMIRYLE
jgi:tetratricopeptide (TPR) repeat protein